MFVVYMSLQEQDPCGKHITKRGFEEIFETDPVGVVECVPQHQVMHALSLERRQPPDFLTRSGFGVHSWKHSWKTV